MEKNANFATLKSALKRGTIIKTKASILQDLKSNESTSELLNKLKSRVSIVQKINYIKQTRASQLMFQKNQNLEPLEQIQFLKISSNEKKYNLKTKMREKEINKKSEFAKAADLLSPIKKEVKATKKIESFNNMSIHVMNKDFEHISTLNKSTQINKNSNISINDNSNNKSISLIKTFLLEQTTPDEFYLEKYTNMINIDNEIFYLGTCFLGIFLECMHDYNQRKNNKNKNDYSSSSISNYALNHRFTNHYSNTNLVNLSKISLESSRTSNRTSKIDASRIMMGSESKISSVNSKSESEDKKPVTIFGVDFPKLTTESLKENIHSFKYLNNKFRFYRILMQNNLKVEMDVGFTEIEINDQDSYLEIHKFYIIKAYRKMQIYENIITSAIQQIRNLAKYKYIYIKVIDRYESYKALLGKLGFRLKEKIRIKNEEISYLVLKK